MKEENGKDTTMKKAGLIIGFALLFFVIIVLGVLIVNKMIIQNANQIKVPDVSGPGKVEETQNYTVDEGGTKHNNAPAIAQAEIDIDNFRFSHFQIIERNTMMEDEAVFMDTEIVVTVESMDAEVRTDAKTFAIKFYDEEDNVLSEFTMEVKDLPARLPSVVRHVSSDQCVNAVRVAVEDVTVELPEDTVVPEE